MKTGTQKKAGLRVRRDHGNNQVRRAEKERAGMEEEEEKDEGDSLRFVMLPMRGSISLHHVYC